MAEFTHLGPFSELVAIAQQQRKLFPKEPLDRNKARELLGFMPNVREAADVQILRHWHNDGLEGEILSWSVGFGPRSEAFFLKPAGARRLPGVVTLYDHGHYKFFGKEKIADGPDGPLDAVKPFRDAYYGGRAFANALARQGFAVLIHDTFLWGSRRFPISHMHDMDLSAAEILGAQLGHGAIDAEILRYNGAAYLHELQLAKYCALLGTSLAAITAYEDRIALNYLANRADADESRLGAIGFSGGGFAQRLSRRNQRPADGAGDRRHDGHLCGIARQADFAAHLDAVPHRLQRSRRHTGYSRVRRTTAAACAIGPGRCHVHRQRHA